MTAAAEKRETPFEAPALTREHIKKELELLHQKKHRTRRTALFAKLADKADDGATVEVAVGGEPMRFRIVLTSGELDFRRKLAREEDDRTAYVVPFSRRLPRDIEASLAAGRLFWPQIESLLPRRFGAKTITPRLRGSKLRLVAQREGTRMYAKGEAPSIDLDDAWLVLLRERLGLEVVPTEAQLFAAVLLDKERRGKALAALLAEIKGAREELSQVLDRRLGPSARWILAAWLEDAAVELAALAVVGEATRGVLGDRTHASYTLLTALLEQRVRSKQKHPLQPLRDAEGTAGLAKALVDLGYLVPLFWSRLGSAGNDPVERAILREAEEFFALETARPLALGSDRLPFVLSQRCKVFLEAIDAVVATPAAPDVMDAMDRAAAELLAHDTVRGEARLREQVEMAARLAAFLGEPIVTGPAADGPHAEVVKLATFQAEVGGWIDRARQVARDDGAGPLGKGLAALIAAVDRARDLLDARFAAAYARLVGPRGERGALRGAVRVDGRSREVLPIEEVVAKMGLDVLRRSEELKLLLLCMDGMSWANLTELWSSIARTSFVPVSQGPRAAVIAHVPTITRLSRSALFGGRTIAPGESLDTTRDGERLAKHKGVRDMGEAPILLLRGDVLGDGGGLSDDASHKVRGDARIVAVVVNAIDDQLKGSAQLRVTLSMEHIRPLRALLDAAEDTGRLVLLTSDHGNVSSQRFVGAAVRTGGKDPEGMERGARHRFLRAGENASSDEIELPAGALAGAKGIDRVAVAVHETVRYTSVLHAGEHGGASLGEVVAPAMLLAPRGLLPMLEELGVEELPLDPPAFWSRETSRAPRPAPAPPAPMPAPAAPVVEKKAPAQVSLPFEAPAPPVAPELAVALFRSRLFKEQIKQVPEPDRASCQKAIELLLRQGGRMGRDPFAVALGIDQAGKGMRVPGFLAKLERVLNVDSEPVVEMDPRGQIITLDAGRLRAVFLEEGDG